MLSMWLTQRLFKTGSQCFGGCCASFYFFQNLFDLLRIKGKLYVARALKFTDTTDQPHEFSSEQDNYYQYRYRPGNRAN